MNTLKMVLEREFREEFKNFEEYFTYELSRRNTYAEILTDGMAAGDEKHDKAKYIEILKAEKANIEEYLKIRRYC